jgi:two-component system sensor histidine kinase PilS (NtrC family)
MFRFLSRALTPVVDSEQETRRHLLWWIATRVFLFTLLIGLAAFFREKGLNLLFPSTWTTSVFLLGLYGFSIGSALLLQRITRSIRRFGVIQLFFDAVFIALLVYATGCSRSDFTSLLILPVIAAGLILYRRGGLFLAAATTLLYGGVLAFEQLGWIPGYFFASSYKAPASILTATNLFAIYGLLFFLAALLSGQLARRLRVTEEKLQRTALEYDRLSILYKQIFDDISTGIITTDHSDFITSYNQAAERITGYFREKVLGQPFSRCFPDILLHKHQSRSVCDFQKTDGTSIRIGYSFSFLNMPEPEEMTEQSTRWKVITLQDISQIERMEQQVREAEKMAAIGELSASIAHDFRNPLAAISGSAQILSMEQNDIGGLDPATLKTLLGIIHRESGRMAKTITDFLQFARPASIQPEWFDFNRLIDEVTARLQAGSNAMVAAAIVKEIDERLDCWGDRQQMQTVMTHLLDNACHAVAARPGSVVVAASEHVVADQGELCVEIRDQGPGIPMELREKVFTPFFSNRTDGTGLGLAIVRQIVENHGGRIEIDDNAAYTCIIRLHLPVPQTATP